MPAVGELAPPWAVETLRRDTFARRVRDALSPRQVNPADVVVDLTHTKEADADEDGGEAVDLVARFAESDLRREMRRVPYLRRAEPSVGSVPWAVR